MCAVAGMVFDQRVPLHTLKEAFHALAEGAHSRGRDGIGWHLRYNDSLSDERVECSFKLTGPWQVNEVKMPPFALARQGVLIMNARAEPTTEWIEHKTSDDQQPYSQGLWAAVHNGTIANDAELRTHTLETTIDSAAIVEQLQLSSFAGMVNDLVGSYAILASKTTDTIYFATNYKPLHTATCEGMRLFSSVHDGMGLRSEPIAQYSVGAFSVDAKTQAFHSLYKPTNNKALVVASSGLDSTVAAAKLIADGYEVTLLHLRYGCNAETREVEAIIAIALHLQVPVIFQDVPLYGGMSSPILSGDDSTIIDGVAGAEYAHEWVPARNLVMLAIATAVAEAGDFSYIALGNNLEEAGAYPDNEPEFIRLFNTILPFAVQNGKRLEVLMPVGNLMKHEIVSLGAEINAPLGLTWSCYRSGKHHCGSCGPCTMRKKAFIMTGCEDTMPYEGDK